MMFDPNIYPTDSKYGQYMGINIDDSRYKDLSKINFMGKEYYSGNSPSLALMNELKKYIEKTLQKLNFETALFLSELYFTIANGLDISHKSRIAAIYLYSLSLYLNNECLTAFNISRQYKEYHICIAYIYARCALKLNKHERDACSWLNRHLSDHPNDLGDNFIFMGDKATIHGLIGTLYDNISESKASMQHQIESLKLDPYLWEIYPSLFNKKITLDLESLFFKDRSNEETFINSNNNNNMNTTNTTTTNNNNSNDSNNYRDTNVTLGSNDYGIPLQSPLNQNTNQKSDTVNNIHTKMESYSNIVTNSDHKFQSTSPTVSKPTVSSLAKINNKVRGLKTTPSKQVTLEQRIKFTTPNNSYSRDTRLGNSTKRKRNIKNSISFINDNNDNICGNGTGVDSHGESIYSNTDTMKIQERNSLLVPSTLSFHRLFYLFVKILELSSSFNCHNVIRIIYDKLPSYIVNYMPWCLAQLGKLHYEISNYNMSLKYFRRLRLFQTTRIKDLEIYSTLLWHLRENHELYTLCNELLEFFPTKPETWCVAGNYFSLIKNHDESIKAFSKAIELNPKFAYAYTLQGHEYTANESYDTAREFYRKAVAIDSQHYNAYYGLGDCAFRLGKYEEALLHFEKARLINPINVILICCCGHALEKLGYEEKALDYYELACKLQPDSTLPKYRRAQLFFNIGRFNLALEQFETLEKMSPNEATVHFMLGQIYQTMGRKNDAIKQYTIALNLDPMGNHVIADALEKCHYQE